METSLHVPGHSLASVAVVALLAIAGLLLYVWRVRGAVGRRDQVVLIALRVTAVAAVIGAYLQVGLRREELVRRPSVVAVLVDGSRSMSVTGAGDRTRAEQVSQFFRDQAGWFDTLEREHDVRYFTFSDRARRIGRVALEVPLPADGGSTDVVAALREAFRDVPPADVGGALVVSDGLDNGTLAHAVGPGGTVATADRNALASLPGPVHALVPAPPEHVRDVALAGVTGLEYLIARNLSEVHCEVRAVGYDSGVLTVSLSEDGEVLDHADVPVEEALRGATVTLGYLPREPGRHVVQIAVSPLPGEVSSANNVRLIAVEVVRDRLRVLHVAGHPSWDERFLRDWLRRRRDVETVSFHTLRPPEAPVASPDDETTLIPFPAEEIFVRQIESFDLVVLQDYDLPEADRERYAQGLAHYVQGGGGLLVLGGSFSLGARGPWPTHLDAVLPVSAPRVLGRGMLEGRFAVEATPEGLRHPVLSAPGLGDLLSRATPMTAVNPVGGIENGAVVLLRATGESPGTPRNPLLVASALGRGRVAVALSDTLWRWSFDPDLDPLYRGVLDGLAGWLTRDPSSAPLRVAVALPRVVPDGEEAVTVTVPPGTADVEVQLQRRTGPGKWEADGSAVILPAGGATTLTTRLAPPVSGVWRVVASAGAGEARIEGSDLFVAAPVPEEVHPVIASVPYLDVLAGLTGGRTTSLAAPDLKSLALRPEVVARVGLQLDEPLWNHPAVFLLLLAALGLEWFVERKIGYT